MQFHCLYNDALSTHKEELFVAFCFGNGCLILWRKNIYSTAACKCSITRPSVWSLTCHKARADDKLLKLETHTCNWFEIDEIAQRALSQDTSASMGLTLDEKTRRVANSPDIQPLRRNDGIRIKKQKQVRKQVHIVHSPHASRGGGVQKGTIPEKTESTRLTVSPKSCWKATRTTPQQETLVSNIRDFLHAQVLSHMVNSRCACCLREAPRLSTLQHTCGIRSCARSDCHCAGNPGCKWGRTGREERVLEENRRDRVWKELIPLPLHTHRRQEKHHRVCVGGGNERQVLEEEAGNQTTWVICSPMYPKYLRRWWERCGSSTDWGQLCGFFKHGPHPTQSLHGGDSRSFLAKMWNLSQVTFKSSDGFNSTQGPAPIRIIITQLCHNKTNLSW